MLDRDKELLDLAQANRHIRESERRIHDLEQIVRAAGDHGHPTRTGHDVLRRMRETLGVFKVHRDAIVQIIVDIDAGRL